jgi:hypothetical protein
MPFVQLCHNQMHGLIACAAAQDGTATNASPANSTARDVLSLAAPTSGWHAAPEEECGDTGCNGAGICYVHEPGSEWSSTRRRLRRRRVPREMGEQTGPTHRRQPAMSANSSTHSMGGPVSKCICLLGYSGKDCQPIQSLTDSSCPLACSGRGVCRGGHCQCSTGSWGPGCAYNTSAWQPQPGSQLTRCSSPQHSSPLLYQQPAPLPAEPRQPGSTLEALRQLPSLVERLSRRPEGLRIWVYPLPTDLVSGWCQLSCSCSHMSPT